MSLSIFSLSFIDITPFLMPLRHISHSHYAAIDYAGHYCITPFAIFHYFAIFAFSSLFH